VQGDPAAEVAARASTVISLRRMVAVVARARSGLARVPAARVRLNAMTASTSQAALAVVKNAWNRHRSNRVTWPAALFFSALK
jgi:hypothetical protein